MTLPPICEDVEASLSSGAEGTKGDGAVRERGLRLHVFIPEKWPYAPKTRCREANRKWQSADMRSKREGVAGT